MDGNERANNGAQTSADRLQHRLSLVDKRIQQQSEMEARMQKPIAETADRITAAICNAFEPFFKRLNGVECEIASIKDRVAPLEDRLLGVEKRLDTPPHA
jgi:hypothetical protein